MKQRIVLSIIYLLFWIIVFFFLKAVQILYHFDIFSTFPAKDTLNIFTKGFILDLSFAAYLSLIPFLLLAISGYLSSSFTLKFLKVYTWVCLFAVLSLFIIDLELFGWWGFKIDKTVLKYLNVPQEMLATASVAPVYLLLGIFLSSFLLISWGFSKFLISRIHLPDVSPYFPLIFLPLTASLIIPIRGGIQQIPVNQSAVYFSNNTFLNQAAVNPSWNFFSSMIASNAKLKKPYSFPELSNTSELIDQVYKIKADSSGSFLIKENPNVLIILWESFTSKVTTDNRNLTPNFNALRKEGIYFSNIYSSGNRSDKGIAAVLSAYPAQPINSILKDATKAGKLPGLASMMNEHGYHSSFYYGGELEFANMKSYLFSSGYSKVVGRNDFPSELDNSKWGVHDEYVFNRVLQDLDYMKEPFFSTFFTLSSHEPFDVPMEPAIEINNIQDEFCNSIAYTDKCLGNFIRKAKKSAWWDNTLVIILADHGHVFPGPNRWASHHPSEFTIPMLWTGGALTKKDTVIDIIGSQTDLAATLFKQLNFKTQDRFPFSRNLLNSHAPDFAWYAFNNGFGLIKRNGHFLFDNTGNDFILREGEIADKDVTLGKAYLQVTFRDYVDK